MEELGCEPGQPGRAHPLTPASYLPEGAPFRYLPAADGAQWEGLSPVCELVLVDGERWRTVGVTEDFPKEGIPGRWRRAGLRGRKDLGTL